MYSLIKNKPSLLYLYALAIATIPLCNIPVQNSVAYSHKSYLSFCGRQDL